MTVPPGLRPPPSERGNFETIEVQVQVAPVAPAAPAEVVKTGEDRADMAVVGPIAALVLALTISTLVLQNPVARVVAASLATLGLIVAVALMLMGKRPQPGRHVALPEADADVPAVPVAPVRVAGTGWTPPDRDGTTVRIASGWSTAEPRSADPRNADPRAVPPAAAPRGANPRPVPPRPAEPRTSRHRRE